jgi:cell cycle sensor histidine kinase DivJ
MGSTATKDQMSDVLGSRGARRLPRAGLDAAAWLAIAGDFVARHRIDGRVLALTGEGWAPFQAVEGDRNICECFDVGERARFLKHVAKVAADACARALVVRLRRRDGEFRPFEVRSAPTGEAGIVLSAFRENLALDGIKAELEATREEARLERSLKDRLLANMSHELRTPLNAILGFSEILGDPSLMPTEAQQRIEYARIIHSSADHLLSVVNLVLDMSRIEAGKFAILPESLELAPLIRECCDMLRLRARAGQVEIVVAPIVSGAEIFADKGACRQIVVNLLSNAVKFTPPQGRVAIEAFVEAGCARIAVTDTGIGIKPEDLPRLGDPFFQVKNGYDRSFEGAGLGLSLVRGLVGLHEGALRLESACGIGTRVTATLPRAPSLNARRAAPAWLETLPRLTLPAILREAREDRRIA